MAGIVITSGQLLLNSGSVGTPALAWTSQTTRGIYLGNGLSHAMAGVTTGDFPGSGVAMRTNTVFGSQSNPFSNIGTASLRFIECWASSGIINTSHSDFKMDIQPLTYTEVPRGVQYRWKDNPDRPYIGFLADSLPKEAFAWDENGNPQHKAVENIAVIGILCDAIGKLQTQVVDLESRISVAKQQRGI